MLRETHTGEGDAIVLLHGYPDTHLIWRPIMQRLSPGAHVVAFDWPGTGDSDRGQGKLSPMDLAACLKELMDGWGMEKATVVGADMGGQVALAFAACFGERTRAVVVMNSLVLGDALTSPEIAVLRRLGLNRWLLRHLPRTVFGRCLRTFGAQLPAEVQADFWRCWHRKAVRETVADWCAAYEAAMPDLPALYRRITGPVRIVWGEREMHFPLEQARRLHRMIAGSHLHVVRGGGHWMAWTHADEIADQIRSSCMETAPGIGG